MVPSYSKSMSIVSILGKLPMIFARSVRVVLGNSSNTFFRTIFLIFLSSLDSSDF